MQSIVAALMLIALGGCGDRFSLKTEYGKIRTEGSSASLNGTRVFAEMMRRHGVTVNRLGTISPKLNRYQTVVWFPDRLDPPADEVVQALEKWITQGWGRTVIYVGRDFDCNLSYLVQVRDHAEVADQEELHRQIAEAIADRRAARRQFGEKVDRNHCDWFKIKKSNRRSAQHLEGPLADGVDSKECALDLGSNLAPPRPSAEPEQNVLLKTDGLPFAFSLLRSQSNGQVIVVRNGSFLLNFALVNPAHRKLAENLIDQCDLTGPVAFLESGPGEVRIQERADAHQPWAWISRPPLRYMVPHLLLWGVLFCFVLFPIFGRARRFQPFSKAAARDSADATSIHSPTNTTSFRAHLVALGKLLQRSEQPSTAREKIQNYLETYGKDSTNQ